MHKKPNETHHSKKYKGQAAMEFLLTYGWAIIVVLVVIAALAYFGVLSPKKLLPGKCLFQIGVQCADYQAFDEPLIDSPITADGTLYHLNPLTFNLVNKLGKTLYVVGLEVQGKAKADYMCMDFKLDCGEGNDWIQNTLDTEALTFTPGKMCVSLNKLCSYEDDCYKDKEDNCLTIIEGGCNPYTAFSWQDNTQLIDKISEALKFPVRGVSLYCLNMPKKGDRVNAQIVITYHQDPQASADNMPLLHTAYGELSTVVS